MELLSFRERMQSAYGVIPMLAPDRNIPGSQYLPIVGTVKMYSDTPTVFEDTTLTYGNEELLFAGQRLSKSGNLSNVFAPPLLWTPRKVKNVSVTELDAGPVAEGEPEPGTEIVERYSSGEWEIAIDGLLVDMDQHIFPLAKLERLRKFFEINAAVQVAGQIWLATGITSIWFYDFSYRGVPGYQDTIAFNVMARSIRPVEFYLNGEEEV